MPLRPGWTAGAALAAALGTTACDPGAATETQHAESPSPSPSPSPDRSSFIAAVDAMAAEALQRGPIAGLSIAVFAHGQPVLAKDYGFADVEARVPAAGDVVPD